MKQDNWINRSEGMRCATCMHFVLKAEESDTASPVAVVPKGRCRRRAPTLNGWPVVFQSDWCGDHKLT